MGVILLLGAWVTPLVGQDDCFPGAQSNEAHTFGILSVPLAFTGAGTRAPTRGVVAGIEFASLPGVPPDQATPTICRPGKGPENTNPLPGIVRFRAGTSVGGVDVEAGWIPPLTISGVRANLLGLALGKTIRLRGVAIGVRGHTLLGSLRAPVTCDEEAVADPSSECLGGEVSEDHWRPGIHGIEVSMAMTGGSIRPHIGIGFSRLMPRFQVGFTNAIGELDQRRVEVDLDRVALFGGASVSLGWGVVTTEAYYTVHDRAALRLVLRMLAVS